MADADWRTLTAVEFVALVVTVALAVTLPLRTDALAVVTHELVRLARHQVYNTAATHASCRSPGL